MQDTDLGFVESHYVTKAKAMKDTWTEAWEQSERKHRELQDRILAIPGSQRVLRRLTKAGAKQEKVLSHRECRWR
jgi:hypothetical protein